MWGEELMTWSLSRLWKCLAAAGGADVDECADFTNGGCEQTCQNLPGGFNCTCRVGFRVRTDDVTKCERESKPPTMQNASVCHEPRVHESVFSSPAVCEPPCHNYGVCVAPNSCDCPPGYPGLGCSGTLQRCSIMGCHFFHELFSLWIIIVRFEVRWINILLYWLGVSPFTSYQLFPPGGSIPIFFLTIFPPHILTFDLLSYFILIFFNSHFKFLKRNVNPFLLSNCGPNCRRLLHLFALKTVLWVLVREMTWPLSCTAAMCSPPCAHGGTCMRWNKCLCPPGWTGTGCHTGRHCRAPAPGVTAGCSHLSSPSFPQLPFLSFLSSPSFPPSFLSSSFPLLPFPSFPSPPFLLLPFPYFLSNITNALILENNPAQIKLL